MTPQQLADYNKSRFDIYRDNCIMMGTVPIMLLTANPDNNELSLQFDETSLTKEMLISALTGILEDFKNGEVETIKQD